MFRLWYSNADAFLVCYSMRNEDSFNNIGPYWVKELNLEAPGVPKFLVGTMADVKTEEDRSKYIPTKRFVERYLRKLTKQLHIFIVMCRKL